MENQEMGVYRFAKTEDAPRIHAIYDPYIADSPVTFEEQRLSVSEMEDRMRKGMGKFPWMVYEDPRGQVVAYAYAGGHRSRSAYRWSTESSIYVDSQWQGKGVAQSLYEQLLFCLKIQGFMNVYAGVTLPNEASVKFHHKMGFKPVGTYEEIGYKGGQWHDVYWCQLRFPESKGQAMEPIPFEDLRSSMKLENLDDLREDEKFLHLFKSAELPQRLWDHRAHVRITWLILNQSKSWREALERVRTHIQKLNGVHGVPDDAYHETVTEAFVRIIAERISSGSQDERWTDFYVSNLDLFSKEKPILLNYYEKKQLESDEARRQFVEPALKALPS